MARKERQIAPQASAGYPLSINPPAYLPQSAAGAGKQSFEEIADTPATAKERYAPHDCKQADFPSGTLKPLFILNMPALWPSTNLEMTFVL